MSHVTVSSAMTHPSALRYLTQEPVGFPRKSTRPFLLYDDYVKPPQATPIYNPPIRPLTVFYNGCEFNF